MINGWVVEGVMNLRSNTYHAASWHLLFVHLLASVIFHACLNLPSCDQPGVLHGQRASGPDGLRLRNGNHSLYGRTNDACHCIKRRDGQALCGRSPMPVSAATQNVVDFSPLPEDTIHSWQKLLLCRALRRSVACRSSEWCLW